MARKLEITGKAVIYTHSGAKIVDAEVRRASNMHADWCTFKINYDGDYLLIGGARDVPTVNGYATPAYNPERINRAFQYANTKFFRQMLDLMRLAQWEPINKANIPLDSGQFKDNHIEPLPFDDKSLYERYGWTPNMIAFAEEKFK